MHGDVRGCSLALARAAKWKGQKKTSLMGLPPDDDSLKQHIMPANFLIYIQHHLELRRHPSPIGRGWELVNGRCRPVRYPLRLSVPSPPQAGDNSDSEAVSEVCDALDSELDISSDCKQNHRGLSYNFNLNGRLLNDQLITCIWSNSV